MNEHRQPQFTRVDRAFSTPKQTTRVPTRNVASAGINTQSKAVCSPQIT